MVGKARGLRLCRRLTASIGALVLIGSVVTGGARQAVASVPTATVGANPEDIAVDAATSTVYVTNYASNSVSVIDGVTCDASTQTGCTPVATIPVGTEPVGVAVDAATNTVYVANYAFNSAQGTVSVIDGTTCDASTQTGCTAVATIAVGSEPFGVAVNASTNTIYVTDNNTSDVEVINGATCDSTSQSGCTPVATTPVAPGPAGVAVDALTNTIYVVSERSLQPSVSVIDGATCDASTQTGCTPIATTFSDGYAPYGVAVDATTNTVYVVNAGVGSNPGNMAVIDGATCDATNHTTSGCTAVATSTAGNGGEYVAVDASTNTVYVTNAGSDTVSVVNGATCDANTQTDCATVATVPVGPTPFGLGLYPASSSSPVTVYVANDGSDSLSIFGQPSAPQAVSATTARNQSATVSWSPPLSDGQLPIGSYSVMPSPSCGGCTGLSTSGSVTNTTISGLTNGRTYTFTVVAHNAVGPSPASAASNSITPYTVPSAPTLVSVTAGDSTATLSWTGPASNGGAAITGYYVYDATRSGGENYSGAPACSTSSATACTVRGLANGSTYYFTVEALNKAGSSSPSNQVSAIPHTSGNLQPPPPPPPHCSTTLPSGTVVGMAVTGDGKGYWIASSTGRVAACGDAAFFGNGPTGVSAIAAAPTGNGYWLATGSGKVEAFGSAMFHGDLSGAPLAKPIVAMSADPATGGYWLLGADGGVFSFHAPFFGSTGNIRLNKPAVGLEATLTGRGYRFVASDGGIFDYGDAHFYGSMGGTPLNKPVVGMADDPATGGYWLDASDGGIFSFKAPFYGSTGNIKLSQPCVGMSAMPSGSGYRFVASDGGIFDFNAPFEGSAA